VTAIGDAPESGTEEKPEGWAWTLFVGVNETAVELWRDGELRITVPLTGDQAELLMGRAVTLTGELERDGFTVGQDGALSVAAATAAQPPACEHNWVSSHVPGHAVYWVRVCTLCMQPDWDDLDREIADAIAVSPESKAANGLGQVTIRIPRAVMARLIAAQEPQPAPVSPALSFTPAGYQGAAQHTYTTACDGFHEPGQCPRSETGAGL
jgi:hypothetical protein